MVLKYVWKIMMKMNELNNINCYAHVLYTNLISKRPIFMRFYLA